MKTPELSTERLILLPYTPDRVTKRHVDWLNDPEVVQFSQQRHIKHTVESQQQAVIIREKAGQPWWVVCLKGDDIGTIRVTVDNHNKVGEIGILIGDKTSWGNGYAAEAWREVMRWCFEGLGLRKVECGCMSPNLAMRRVAENCGMRIEGGRPSHFLLDGKPVDAVYYGKMRE